MQASDDKLDHAIKILKGEYDTPRQSAPPPVEPFKTLTAVTREIGITRTTLWRYRVPGHTHAGRVRYRTSEVLAYLDTPAFQVTVAAMRANGWNRPTDAEIAAMTPLAVLQAQSADSGRESALRTS
jgi:hypothetical protein